MKIDFKKEEIRLKEIFYSLLDFHFVYYKMKCYKNHIGLFKSKAKEYNMIYEDMRKSCENYNHVYRKNKYRKYSGEMKFEEIIMMAGTPKTNTIGVNMSKTIRQSKKYLKFVFLHEISHMMLGHTQDNRPNSIKEKEADEYALKMMKRMEKR